MYINNSLIIFIIFFIIKLINCQNIIYYDHINDDIILNTNYHLFSIKNISKIFLYDHKLNQYKNLLDYKFIPYINNINKNINIYDNNNNLYYLINPIKSNRFNIDEFHQTIRVSNQNEIYLIPLANTLAGVYHNYFFKYIYTYDPLSPTSIYTDYINPINNKKNIKLRETKISDNILFSPRNKKIYDNTIKSDIIYDYGIKKLKKLRFLHIPKTGSSFSITLFNYLSDFYEGNFFDPTYIMPNINYTDTLWKYYQQPTNMFNDLIPHIPYFDSFDSGYTVTIFREPYQRLVSQLLFLKSHGIFGETFGFKKYFLLLFNGIFSNGIKLIQQIENIFFNELKLNFKSSLNELKLALDNSNLNDPKKNLINAWYEIVNKYPEYRDRYLNCILNNQDHFVCKFELLLNFPGMKGCQTKMIIGMPCSLDYKLIPSDLIHAKNILKEKFLYFGITNRWKESVQLFHSMFGGKLYKNEYDKFRKGIDVPENIRKAIQSSNYTDFYDDSLYNFALELFEERLKQYNISINDES